MKNYFYMLLVFTGLSLASCSSTQKAFQSAPVLSRSVTLDPIKADIVVDQNKNLKVQVKLLT